jgi:hypothetical protein
MFTIVKRPSLRQTERVYLQFNFFEAFLRACNIKLFTALINFLVKYGMSQPTKYFFTLFVG